MYVATPSSKKCKSEKNLKFIMKKNKRRSVDIME